MGGKEVVLIRVKLDCLNVNILKLVLNIKLASFDRIAPKDTCQYGMSSVSLPCQEFVKLSQQRVAAKISRFCKYAPWRPFYFSSDPRWSLHNSSFHFFPDAWLANKLQNMCKVKSSQANNFSSWIGWQDDLMAKIQDHKIGSIYASLFTKH